MAKLPEKWKKLSQKLDGPIAVISPRAARRRAAERFAYDVIDKSRTRKKRKGLKGTGDGQLTEQRLADLRDTARDLGRNNPLAVGLLKIERNGVVGSQLNIQARAKVASGKSKGEPDKAWNDEAEALWKENMVQRPVDVTGRYNVNQYIRKAYLSYRRDGDFLTAFLDNGLMAAEGDQIGTPFGKNGAAKREHIDVINGVAYSKKTGRLIGYYVGKPNKWGYIQQDSYRKYIASRVYFWINGERFSQSRGEPIMTASIPVIDAISDYFDAALVAAKVNACYTMFISKKESYGEEVPAPYTKGISSTGLDADDNQLEKMEPGTILYGEDGESATGVGQVHPGSQFDPFVRLGLAIGFRPMCIPLMLILGDFSGATFMNMRAAYGEVRDMWQCEQQDVVKPFAWHVWRWFIDRMIAAKKLKDRPDKYAVDVVCNRWPYVDPFKEAKGDEQQLKNGTTNRTTICARQGTEYADVEATRIAEEAGLKESGRVADAGKNKIDMENIARAIRTGVPVTIAEARTALGMSPKVNEKEKMLRFNDQDLLAYHIQSGISTINEARAVLTLPAVSWGNVPVRSTSMAVVDPNEKEGGGKGEKDESADDAKDDDAEDTD